ncbi:membrane protein [Tersicoccus solisilvae]|uniref:Membrane protein n=1 Tax=Tersicoccus solisilvae TaxID=1882339 RepID=A0ABQ1PAF8_9MICC|nr:PH domain-containing protein [Tersicoccus solisilvae]GGC93650.1 membrane protein [Tersicoccus solisilvae]
MTVASPVRGGIDAPSTWHRVHPASPLVRGWLALVAVYVVFGRDWLQNAIGSMADPSSREPGPDGVPIGIIVVVAVVPLVVVLATFFASWWFTRYQVTTDHVRINSGVLFRQNRQARLDRVQAIDINQPLLARLLRLAELKFEVADAGQSAMRLSFLRLDEAEQLRATILGRAAGVHGDPAHPDVIVSAPERPVLTVPPQRVLGAAVLSGMTVWLLVAAAVTLLPAVFSGQPLALAAVIPVVFGAGTAYWAFFTRSFNFRVAHSPDGVRLHYGLLETHAQTVPPGRVQAVSVHAPLLWRPLGWHRVEMNVAGYGTAGSEQNARTVLLPVGTFDEVLEVMALVLPRPGVDDPVAVFRAGLHGTGSAEGFVPAPARARWLDPLAFRRNGFQHTETAILVRSGRLTRRLAVVPHERTQSVALQQGPLQRRLGLAHVHLHSTAGPVKPVVPHLAVDVARRLFTDQAERAARARRAAGPEQWMLRRATQDAAPIPPAPVAAPDAAPGGAPTDRHGDRP